MDQKQFEHLIEQMDMPIFALNADQQVILWNEACEDLTGMSAAQVMGTRDHWQAFYSTKRPCLADLVLQNETSSLFQHYPTHSLTSRGAQAENWCVVPKLGSLLRLDIHVKRVLDEQGRLVLVMETLFDITAATTSLRWLRAALAHKGITHGFMSVWPSAFPAVAVGLAVLERHGPDCAKNLAVTSLVVASATAFASVIATAPRRDRSHLPK